MTLLLDSPDAPLETGLFTYKLVAYAGEGWESQTPTNMRIFQYPIAMTIKFQHQFDRIVLVGYTDEHSVRANDFMRRQHLDVGRAKLRCQLSCERVAGVRSRNWKYVTGEDMLDAYWQMLCAGCKSETFNTVRQEFLSFDEAMKSLSVFHKVNLSSSSLLVTFMFYYDYIQRFIFPFFSITPQLEWNGFSDRMVFAMGRPMVRSSEGYVGLVPATAQPDQCGAVGGWYGTVHSQKGRHHASIGRRSIHSRHYERGSIR